VAFLARIGSSFKRTGAFFRDSWMEMKKVRWPNRAELTSYTVVVITTVTLLALFFAIVDLGISRLIELILAN
jgi:preprotein translocase, SecE subunit, bacterial